MAKRAHRTHKAPFPEALRRFATAEGASVFDVPAEQFTPDHERRLQEIAGAIDAARCVEFYRQTQNPTWLWISIAVTPKGQALQPDVTEYLRNAATQIFSAVTTQVTSSETVRVVPGEALEESVERRKVKAPKPPRLEDILGFSHPGRNAIQDAAGDFRDVSFAVAAIDRVEKGGSSYDDAYTALAHAVGRITPDMEPAVEAVRAMVARGRKLLSSKET